MANRKISELTAAGALTGAELVEVVQGGVNKQTTTQDIADLGGGGGGGVTSVNGDSGPTVNLNANDIPFTPAGTIIATDVQAALQELDSDIINAIAGLKWKSSVRVATTADGTLATAYENGDTVDGVVLATGDRILIKNQATQTDNGIYTVNASGAPTRATDADSASELESAAVSVQEGTTNANTTWLQTTDSITLGVSNIVWTGFGSSVPDATESTKGIAEIATQAETNTGTDDEKIVTPEKLANYTQWNTKLDSLVSFRTETASHTLDATDLAAINAGDNYKIKMNVGSANNLTIPLNATQAFPTGTSITIHQIGAGQTTIVATGGVTINSENGWTKIQGQYASVVITKTATNTWDLEGTLAP